MFSILNRLKQSVGAGRHMMSFSLFLILMVLLYHRHAYFIETMAGRAMLLAFVMLIACYDRIMGIVAVGGIIIIGSHLSGIVRPYNYDSSPFSSLGIGMAEGFTSASMPATLQPGAGAGSAAGKKAKEGFCLSDRENNMLRSKQSNSMPSFSNRSSGDNVAPFDDTAVSNYNSF